MARPFGNHLVTEARRQSILVSAFSVFAKSGFRGGTLKQVAELEGISEAGVLHHFKSKSALLTAVLEYRDLGTEYNLLPTDNPTGESFLASWLALIAYNMDNKGIVELFCILSAEATDTSHPAHEYFKNRYQHVLELTTGYFQTLKAEEKLEPHIDPVSSAKSLIAISDGLQVQWLLDPSWDMLEEHRGFFRNVLKPEFAHLVAAENAWDTSLFAGR
jgi:AcrR family transcriptional regulator